MPTSQSFLLIYCAVDSILTGSLFRSSEAREQPSSGLKQELLPDRTTVYANKPIHCLYTHCHLYTANKLYIYVRCISFGICCVSLYWGDQVIEYKYVVNLHWGFEFERSQRFHFLEFLFEQCRSSSVGQMRCHHRSNHLCLSVSSSTQQQQPMFEINGARPPSIYFTNTTTKRCSIFDKKIWRGKSQPTTTKWNCDICWEPILYLSICHWRNWKIWIFSCNKLTTWTYLKCAKSYLSSLVNVNTFNHWINVIFIFAANLFCAFYVALFR